LIVSCGALTQQAAKQRTHSLSGMGETTGKAKVRKHKSSDRSNLISEAKLYPQSKIRNLFTASWKAGPHHVEQLVTWQDSVSTNIPAFSSFPGALC